MPFGLCNAPATFECLTEKVLVGLPLTVSLIYLVNILHIQRSHQESAGGASPPPCSKAPKNGILFQLKVKFLEPAKLELQAVRAWPRPSNVSEARMDYARIIRNLYQTLQTWPIVYISAQVFNWNDKLKQSFASLKRTLTEATLLCYPDPEAHFVLDTDASTHSIGAVLSQIKNGKESRGSCWA